MSPQAKQRAKLIVAGVLALALAIGSSVVAVSVANSTARSPKAAAERYLQALVDGRLDDALKLSSPRANSAQRKALRQEIFQKAEHRISEFCVVSSQAHGDSAKVKVEVTQDQKKTTFDIGLHRAQNSAFEPQNWELDSPLTRHVSIQVPSDVTKLRVNGVEITSEVANGQNPSASSGSSGYCSSCGGDSSSSGPMTTWDLEVLPGQCSFEVPLTSKFLGYGAAQAVDFTAGESGEGDSGSSNDPLVFRDKFSAELIRDATNEIFKHIDLCIAKRDFAPANCPNTSRVGSCGNSTDYRNPTWSLVSKSTLQEPQYSGNCEGSFTTDEPGSATLKYQDDSSYGFGERQWTGRTDTASLSFTVRVTVSGDTYTFDRRDRDGC